jgi:hypothetical protein
VATRDLNSTKTSTTIELEFQRLTTYTLCMKNEGSQKQHAFFEFPLRYSDTIGSGTQLNEGVSALQFLSQEIDQTAQVVRESIEKTTVFDATYDDMETNLYASLFIKVMVLIIVCSMQCWLFMRMLGKKTIEYKRVDIPI